MGKAVIFEATDVKTLKSAININSVASILTGTDDPTVVAKNAPQGSIYLKTGASGGQTYIKQDAGNTTNWTQLSVSGSIPSGTATSTSVVTSATTTFVTAITTSVTLTQTAPIFANAEVNLKTTTAASVASIRVTINGVAGQVQSVSLLNVTDNYTGSVQYISASLAPGAYTINFQISRLSGTGTVNFTQGSLTAVGLQGASTNGITQLTGDVTAGPGNGSQVATIAAAAVTGAKIASATITGANIAATTITNANIANTTINLTTKVTGTLPFANGGTGATTFANTRIPFSNGTNFVTDGLFLFTTANTRFYVGQAGGTGRINGTVTATDPVTTDLAGNFFSRGSNNCLQAQNENAWTLSLVNAGQTAVGAAVNFEASRGTLVARTQTQSGDITGTINTQGYTGTTWNGFSGAIQFVATEAVTTTNQGGEIILSTTPNGAAAVVERFRITQAGHLKSTQASPPTTTTNANAGTGASSSVSNATDVAGIVNLTTGTLATATGEQVKINFNKAYTTAPIVVITSHNANAATNLVIRGVYATSTTTDFSINFTVAETLGTAYTWYYYVIETQ